MAADNPSAGAPGQDAQVFRAAQAPIAPADKTIEAPAKRGRPALPGWGLGGKQLVVIMVVSHAVQHFYAGILPMVYPFALKDFGVSLTDLGLVLGAVGILGGLLQGAAGFIPRVSARFLLSAQNVGLAVATVLAAIAPAFGLFGLARGVGALVSWPQHPVGSALLANRFPERRGTVLTWHTTGGSLGTIAVPIIAGVIIATWGWRSALWVFAVPLLIGGILVAIFLRNEHGVGGAHRPAAATVPLKQALRRRAAIVILLVSTIAAGGRGLGVLNAYIPSYLERDLGFNPVLVGVVFSVLVISSVVGPPIEGYISDRIGHLKILQISYLVGAVGIAAYPLVGANFLGLILSGSLIGLFAYADSAMLQSLFSEATHGAAQRAAFGVFFAIAYGVGSLWSPAIGAIIDNWGFQNAFFVMAGSFVLAAAVSVFAREGRPAVA